ncbi:MULTISPECIES: FtsX-like permease family protein [Microbacterium]|uniref:FtsX-like permease family protein n=1 Tax=Microbacterium paraoxydans TaxID=199592 RepID=A0ABZ2HV66_9MICO|nr:MULTISPECIES: FtsX-like permease family protein [Microbacterium]AMG84402.1 permease [Microbacterium sp. PAMC 28756]OSP00058.1 permease [Microbacterium sp. LEMMJ01]QXE31302.1 permease [Microbacterium paraoxydans]
MNLSVLGLLLRPAPGQRSVLALPIVAFAVVTTLVLTVVGGAQAFWTWTDDEAVLYQGLAAIALVLLVVPLTSLGGAAARLSARRRDERLSTLRLLGVTPGGVTTATVVESVLVAAAGAVIGIGGHLALSPLIGLIPFRGEPLGLAAVVLSPVMIAAVVGGVLLLAAGSAVVGLRRVVISPLGVRTRTAPTNVHWIRAVIAVAGIAIAFALIKVFPMIGGVVATIAVLAAMFALALSVLNLLGPWVLKVSAGRQLRRAERPERLLAARLVLDSPKAAWRQVGGIAMASFMAVFAGTGVALLDTIGASDDPSSIALAEDIRTGLIITLIGSFLMVAASVGVNQASDVLDKSDLHESLHHLGMPVETVDRARRRAIMSPLLVTAVGSALCAAVLVFPLVGIALIVAPLSLMTIATVVAVGIGVVWASTWATRPLLDRAFAPA